GDIRTMGVEELTRQYGPAGVLVDGSESLNKAFEGLQSSADLSTLFLILATLFWLGENLLGHRIARRQQ
ncbi:MAG: hypothetical protein D6820_07240, partial [Lentisphaerae bacterium]